MGRLLGFVTAAVAAAWAARAGGQLKADEEVVFFPTAAVSGAGGWSVPVHGWVHEPEADSVLRAGAVAALARSLGVDGEAEGRVFRERARLFLVDNERGKRIAVRVGGRELPVGTSRPNGHVEGALAVPAAEAAAHARDGWLPFRAVTRPGDTRVFPGAALLLAADGVSVVSDIDDTVKVSQVRDRRELARNTFLREFQPVQGMADLYRRWAGEGAAFHYVSASPWQLYPPLSRFLADAGFPRGTFHLKTFRAKDSSFFDLFASPEAYKRGAIAPLLEAFPRRRLVLVGDSGEKDPEIYGALAREHPHRVAAVLIRDVTGDPPAGERYRLAFEGVPAGLWRVFADPAELAPLPLPR